MLRNIDRRRLGVPRPRSVTSLRQPWCQCASSPIGFARHDGSMVDELLFHEVLSVSPSGASSVACRVVAAPARPPVCFHFEYLVSPFRMPFRDWGAFCDGFRDAGAVGDTFRVRDAFRDALGDVLGGSLSGCFWGCLSRCISGCLSGCLKFRNEKCACLAFPLVRSCVCVCVMAVAHKI